VGKVFLLSSPGFSLLWVGTLAFCVQIYADFSAYTDIARGSARCLGFELMQNFNHPYISETPTEFWRRWHISLSSWFRDYVYIPLGGNRVSPVRHYLNLWITFVLSGLWHGASWNFVIWGAYHGTLLVIYQLVERVAPFLIRSRWLSIPRVLLFFALTNVGWLMFQEQETAQLFRDLMIMPGADSLAQRIAASHFLGVVLIYSLPLVADTLLAVSGVYARARTSLPWLLANGAAVVALLVGLGFLHSGVSSDFIYFQF
jgi:D-alanyl-lipoteichoic acid acyltransferase DltB (MBOAT superfamily)